MAVNRAELLELCRTNPEAVVDIIEKQDRLITQLTERIVQLEARIAELEARLNRTSRNSSQPPSMDGFRRVQSPRKRGERPPGGQKGHKGQTLEMVDNPDEIEVHQVRECQGCGASLVDENPVKIERRQVHDAEFRIQVTEHRAEHKRCPHCGRVNRADFPSDVQFPVQYGQNLKALMVYLCVYQLIPYDRIRETFSDIFGRSLSTGTLVNAVWENYRNLAGVEEQIRELLTGSDVIHVDETGMRVAGIRQWLHVASTDFLTWYGHHRKRGKRATDDMQILPRFKGTMVHDFWAPYFRYPGRHAICNAHLLRELNGISENYQQTWSQDLHSLILEIKQEVDAARAHSCSLGSSKIADFEERYFRILEKGLNEIPSAVISDSPTKRGRKKQSKAKNLLNRCRNFPHEILAFMYNFSIPFTNNLAERDIRMAKLQQKISGTFRSEVGAAAFCRIRGYISTVKKNERPVLDSLAGAFQGTPFIPLHA
ncbi:IS66 family transposase [Methanoregula sp.]|uniref:IS66 family transposase n=1 Tax=Methanoregula sp. TaxID=2052170 RepID=UPI000CC4A9EC|nr:IS66 family transposase [Methanoregula sp.]PKG31891.1 MAG: IS66 family transposase [Methanoregula sp.]